jgi:hypothetical protein
MFPPFDTFVCSPRPSSGSPGSAPAFPTFMGTMGSYDSCPARRGRSLVSLDRLLPLPPDTYISREETGRSPKFLEKPLDSVPWASDSGGS